MARTVTKKGHKRWRRTFWTRLMPSAPTRRRWLRVFRKTPAWMRVAAAVVFLAAASLAVNWVYQVYRKPTELFFPISGTLYKDPAQTWRAYGALFRRHSTPIMTPTLLAALAQVEGSGNPLVRTYWRLSLTDEPFEIYRPASSAVGMYQITDGTFSEARHYCIHDHAVATDEEPWYSLRGCWLNSLYMRTVPSDAIELTSAYLDLRVAEALRGRPKAATLRERQRLAALIHLCGPGLAGAFVRRGFAPAPGQRCGSHDVRTYLTRVDSMQRTFAALDARG
jgi:hypothetical protein